MVAQPARYPIVYTDRLITAEDLAAMPEHEHYELVLGRSVPVAPASTDHGALGSNLTRLIMSHVYDTGLGRTYIAETGFDITRPGDPSQTVLGADLAFIQAGRVPARGGKPAFKKVAPDFVYEITSVVRLPVGTNLGMLHLLWMLVSGRLLATRGAVIPGLHECGLSRPVDRLLGTTAAPHRPTRGGRGATASDDPRRGRLSERKLAQHGANGLAVGGGRRPRSTPARGYPKPRAPRCQGMSASVS